MSQHAPDSLEALPADGERVDITRFSGPTLVAGVVGAVGVLLSLVVMLFMKEARESMAYSWLFAFFYFFTLALGGLFWILLHNASNSGWGIAVRRIMEHVASMTPWMFLFLLPILVFPSMQNALYEWMELLRAGSNDVLLEAKAPYLTFGFFYIRIFLYFVVLSGMVYFLRKMSIGQDDTGALKNTFLARRISCGFLPVFAICATFMAFDLILCLDYTWFSTMWGVYIFAGSALSSMALIILTVTLLRSKGYLKLVTLEHYHIMGKLMFAFCVFWAYISFSQFFLYWYANITEETKFSILRNTGGWYWVSIFIVVGHFIVPFLFLLRQAAKKDMRQICAGAIWILFMHAVDVYWMVIPERGPSLIMEPTVKGAFVWDILAFVAIGGCMAYIFLRTLGRHRIYPNRDPRLLESARLVN